MSELTETLYEQAADWVVRLNDAELTEEELMGWQDWLAADERHAQAFHEVQETWRRSASIAAVAVQPNKRPAPVLLAAAASVLLAIAAVFLFARKDSVETTTAELRSVRLPDGSRASLGPETQFKVEFSSRGRILNLRGGEAYFEVVREPERPFSVLTPGGKITALGTAFTVNATQDRLAVSVTEGSVRIDPSGVVIKAGQRWVRDHEQTELKPLLSSSEAIAWQQGHLQYQNERLGVVVADINRYSPVKVRLGDAALEELRYTGTVFPDSLDVWLASLEGVFPLQVQSTMSERRLVARP